MKATLTFDRYLLDSLMADLVGHDRRPSSFLVLMAIWAAGEGGAVALSYAQLASKTGLSKRSVQDAVTHLCGRELLHIDRRGATDTPRYRPLTPWKRWRRAD